MPPRHGTQREGSGAAPVTEATAAEGCGKQEAAAAPTGSRPVPEPYQRVASLAMAKPSPPPPPNSGLRILLAKDRTATSSPSAPAVVSSHADRGRIIKQTVLVLEENQTLENALQRLLRELVEEFEEYAEKAKTLPDTTTNESKLCLYSLYKQATVGPVNTGIFTFYAPFLSFPYYKF
ncbi:hypothetical protein ZWY2020_056562 [Hordeum vulgare]|nr:hypothetical protein ZWY2020_056562 [Hordeum vulgare]